MLCKWDSDDAASGRIRLPLVCAQQPAGLMLALPLPEAPARDNQLKPNGRTGYGCEGSGAGRTRLSGGEPSLRV